MTGFLHLRLRGVPPAEEEPEPPVGDEVFYFGEVVTYLGEAVTYTAP